MRLLATLTIVGSALISGGCYVGPDHLADTGLVNSESLVATKDRWWAAANAPCIAPHARVAVVEFSVEFVAVKKLGLFGTRPIIDIQDYSISGGAAHLAGLGREKILLDEHTLRSLPDDLYRSFIDQLSAFGLEVLPAEAIASAPALDALDAFEPGESLAGIFLSPAGSDTGRPKQVRVFPAAPLRVLRGDSAVIHDAAARTADALDADYALRVVIRLGADNGYASIERESHITVVPRAGVHDPLGPPRVYAVRSLLSDGIVSDHETFELLSGTVTTLNPALYRHEIRTLAEPYLSMGIASIAGLAPPVTAAAAGIFTPQPSGIAQGPDAPTPGSH